MYVDLGYRPVFGPCLTVMHKNAIIKSTLLMSRFKLTGPESNYITIGNQLITELLSESGTTWTRETGLTVSKC
jgi:hypothetical protein